MKPTLQYTYKNGCKVTIWLDSDGNEYSTSEACRVFLDNEDVIGIRLKKKRRRLLLIKY